MRCTRVVACALLLSGCAARTLPPEPPAAGLYRDLERLVTITETAGWEIDRIEIEETLPDALQSVCRAPADARHALRDWLDRRITAEGGDPEQAWRSRGRDLDAIDTLLELYRMRLVLDRAIAVAADECPFWIEPQPSFRGRQISDDRWLLSAGGGGQGIATIRDGEADIRGGGAGRLVLGRQLGSRFAALGGVELGGNASFPKDDEGQRGSLVLGFDAAFPAIVRYTLVNAYGELETGPILRVTEDDTDPAWGIRIGVSVGGRASRRRWFFPGAAFGVAYERTFPDADEGATAHLIKVGFRVAFDVDF